MKRDAREPLSKLARRVLFIKGERKPLTLVLESIDGTTFFFSNGMR